MRLEALRTGCVRTLLGRTRRLPNAQSENSNERRAALRAAINTPVQGGAADVVTAAMLRLHASHELRSMGYRLVHQVHDEVLLEGPEGCAQSAAVEVRRLMEDPLPFKLSAPLVADVYSVNSWHDAKRG